MWGRQSPPKPRGTTRTCRVLLLKTGRSLHPTQGVHHRHSPRLSRGGAGCHRRLAALDRGLQNLESGIDTRTPGHDSSSPSTRGGDCQGSARPKHTATRRGVLARVGHLVSRTAQDGVLVSSTLTPSTVQGRALAHPVGQYRTPPRTCERTVVAGHHTSHTPLPQPHTLWR